MKTKTDGDVRRLFDAYGQRAWAWECAFGSARRRVRRFQCVGVVGWLYGPNGEHCFPLFPPSNPFVHSRELTRGHIHSSLIYPSTYAGFEIINVIS